MSELAAALPGLLRTRELGRALHAHDVIGSTNDEALRLARAGAPHGTLVVAEGGDGVAPYAIASRSGEFTIFNVPSGAFELAGYKRGQQLERTPVDASGGSVSDVQIESSEAALGSVSGNVNIVNAPGGSLTSVVLVPESVFDARLERGAIPLGLRAPGLPDAPSVSGAFSFDQVPQGDYVVLAAFENDGLVRDHAAEQQHAPRVRDQLSDVRPGGLVHAPVSASSPQKSKKLNHCNGWRVQWDSSKAT